MSTDATDHLPPGLPEPVAFPASRYTLPSDQMVIRRCMQFEFFEKTVTDGELYFGPAASYVDMDPHEGQASEPVRAREQIARGEPETLVGGHAVDYHAGFKRLRQASQRQYFLSCWRLGTDESIGHWEEFAPGSRGVAIETTVGQLRWSLFPNNERAISMGKVRYIDRKSEPTANIPSETYFFKGQAFNDYTFTDENEFRAVLAGGKNPIIDIRKDPSEDERFPTPDYPDKLFAAMDIDEVVNRIILTPNTDDVEGLKGDVLTALPDEADVAVEVSPLRTDPDHCPSHAVYGWQNPSAAFFPRIAQRLFAERRKHEIEVTDWSKYRALDWVQVIPVWAKNNLQGHARAAHFEVFRYEPGDTLPDLSAYSHDHLMYARRVLRYINGEHRETWERWDTEDIDPVEAADTPVTVDST